MRRFTFLAPFAVVAALAACDNSVDAPDMAHLTIMLTDAPGDISSAVVTISSIYLQGGAGDEDDPAGRVILLDEPVTTDLLTLANDVQTLVDGEMVAAGTYGQLRFVVEGAYIVVETDQGDMTYATPDYAEAPAQVDGILACPSCSESGFKVSAVGGLTLDDEEVILVDFDVAETFGHEAGNTTTWVMNPSLKTAPIASN